MITVGLRPGYFVITSHCHGANWLLGYDAENHRYDLLCSECLCVIDKRLKIKGPKPDAEFCYAQEKKQLAERGEEES